MTNLPESLSPPTQGSVVEPKLSSLAASKPSPLQILTVATSILIVAEDSLWFSEKGVQNDEAFKLAWENYEASGKAAVVAERVRALSEVNFGELWQDDMHSSGDREDSSGDREDSSGDDKDAKSKAKEEWVQKMSAIVKEFKVQPQS